MAIKMGFKCFVLLCFLSNRLELTSNRHGDLCQPESPIVQLTPGPFLASAIS